MAVFCLTQFLTVTAAAAIAAFCGCTSLGVIGHTAELNRQNAAAPEQNLSTLCATARPVYLAGLEMIVLQHIEAVAVAIIIEGYD
jgi:hypothetical protein